MLLNKIKPLFIPYVLILIAFINTTYEVIIKIFEIRNYSGINFSDKSFLSTLGRSGIFKAFIIILLPTMAVLIRRKISWFIILAYFYFVIWNIFGLSVLDLRYNDDFHISDLVLKFVFLVIMLILIYIMNGSHSYEKVYKLEIQKRNLFNLLALICGFVLSFILMVRKNNQYIDMLQF